MALVLLLLGVVLAGFWIGRRRSSDRVLFVLMPLDDQPPVASDEPWPSARRLDHYVAEGLAQIDAFLAGQHPGPVAPPEGPAGPPV